MTFYQSLAWHAGESEMRTVLRAPEHDNPTVPALSPQLSNHLQIAPLLAIGTLDAEARPWTTLWGGEPGFARPLGGGIVGIRTAVTARHDPVVEELVGREATDEVVREAGQGRMVAGLTLDLETRKRVKMFGRMVAGALGTRDEDEELETTSGGDPKHSTAEIQLVLKIEQSLGNCPKYLNKKHIVPARSDPKLVSDSPQLTQAALDLLAKADLFFISSSQYKNDMDTNHRGGPAGFIRVAANDASGAVICYPEYSGNRLYQTLGNLKINPRAGISIPDFETGDMLYLTGETEVLVGTDAAAALPRSNIAVKLTVTAARFVTNALPFRGVPGEASPYNPTIRYLPSENKKGQRTAELTQQATLLSQTSLTPTISRFRFALANNAAADYKSGQYVTLDLSAHLDVGYSHMRDDDPRSLNDDFVRTFTVSSPARPDGRLKDDEFEITIRRVGVVTDFLFGYKGKEQAGEDRWGRGELDVGVKGFDGEFEVRQEEDGEVVCFVAAGVGITPLLPSLHTLDMARLQVLWSIRAEDAGLVQDALEDQFELVKALRLFVTDGKDDDEALRQLRERAVDVQTRRIRKDDLDNTSGASKYYLCTGTPMRKQLLGWLEGKQTIFEDFNF